MRPPLVLTGPPAVSKTTTAGRLAARLDLAAVVDVDDVRQLVRAGHRAPWEGAEGRRQARLGVENACALAFRFTAAGIPVVVTDVLTVESTVAYRTLLPGCRIVRLHLAAEEARRRAATRPVHLTRQEQEDLFRADVERPVAADHHLDVTALDPVQQSLAVLELWG